MVALGAIITGQLERFIAFSNVLWTFQLETS